MKIHQAKVFGSLTFILFLFSSLVLAGEQKILLKEGPQGKGAHGEAMIKDKGMDQKEISLEVSGLKPESVYTFWLVNMKPKMDMIGVGAGDYSFKSDAKGNGHFSGEVTAAELVKWEMIEIAHHPDNDPKNMKNMGIVLKGNLK